jgi:hypothetical protein
MEGPSLVYSIREFSNSHLGLTDDCSFYDFFSFTQSIYRSIDLSIYLSIYLWIYSPFVGPWPLFSFLIFTQSVGILRRGISPSQGRYLHTDIHAS